MFAHRLRIYLSLALFSASLACESPSRTSATKTSPPVFTKAVSDSLASPISLSVRAPYLATLVYTLDRAAGVKADPSNYRQWLVPEGSKTPDWLTAYAKQRRTWKRRVGSGENSVDALLACSYQMTSASSLEQLIDCWSQYLKPASRIVAQTALRQADKRLRQGKPRQLALENWQQALEALVEGPRGQQLIAELARSCALPKGQSLSATVILVARPASYATRRAYLAGSYLVMEVPDDALPKTRVHVLFHELAHFAAKYASGRAELEGAFAGKGRAGLVAAGLWGEAFATAFGNVMAAKVFDPSFTINRALYADPAIDNLARALAADWQANPHLKLDAAFAVRMVQLVDEHWPAEQWRMADIFGHTVAVGDTPGLPRGIRQGSKPRRLFVPRGIPDKLDISPKMSKPHALVVFATLETLKSRPDVLVALGLTLQSVTRRLTKTPSAAHWDNDLQATPRVLLVATDNKPLRAATKNFWSQSPHSQGWVDLPLVQ